MAGIISLLHKSFEQQNEQVRSSAMTDLFVAVTHFGDDK